MSARRNWYFSTVAVAALSLGLDAAAEKPSFGIPKFPDLKPAWAGPGKGPSPLLDRSNPAGRGSHFDRGAYDGYVPATGNRSESIGSSTANSPSGHDGNGSDKSNKGGGGHGSPPGKDKHDAPDESVQANVGDMNARPVRTIPTCR